jgi:hypothetical protein
LLRTQGYLVADRRLGGAVLYWKLRFRFHRRLRSIYLGADLKKVERVRAELAAWQEARESARERARLESYGRKKLREAKAQLGPALARIGYRFHGDALRRRRLSNGAIHF